MLPCETFALPMWLALLTPVVAVLAGTLLAMAYGPRHWLFGPVRSFALAAVIVTVLVHLLPESIEAIGPWALGVFAAGLVLPILLGKMGQRVVDPSTTSHSRIAIELSYLGLLVHKFGDGVALGTFTGNTHSGHHHLDLVLGIGGHTVPMAAVVVFAYVSQSRSAAVLRAGGLAVAMLVGVLATDLGPTATMATLAPWLNAAVAGLLLHVITHDLPEAAHRRPLARSAEVLAVIIGLGLPMLAGEGHGEGHDAAVELGAAITDAFAHLALAAAPLLLLGFFLTAVLQTYASKLSLRWLQPGGELRRALRGALSGAPLPICSCGVLPLADTLRARGVAVAAVVAFLIAAPAMSLETYALTLGWFGWELAVLRLFGALALAVTVALLVARIARASHASSGKPDKRHDTGPIVMPAPSPAPRWQVLSDALDELLTHIGPWLLLGLLVAAYVQVLVPAGALAEVSRYGLDIAVVILIAVPSYVDATAATPLAIVLVGKGLSPGAAFAGLLLGPAISRAGIAFLRRRFGARATALGLLAGIALVGALAAGVNLLLPRAVIEHALAAAATPSSSVLAAVCAAVLLALAMRTIWRSGLGAWIHALGIHDHGHAHPHEGGGDHAYGHDHDHGHHHHHGHAHDHDD